MGISNNLNDETETARHDWLNYFWWRNAEQSVRQAEGLSLAGAQGMGCKNVETSFYDGKNSDRK
jgi:hypothetical protein